MKWLYTLILTLNLFLTNNSFVELNSDNLYLQEVELNPGNIYQTSINFKHEVEEVYLYIECDNTKLSKMINLNLKQGSNELLNVSLDKCSSGLKIDCKSLEKIDLSLKINAKANNEYALEKTNLKISIYDKYQIEKVKTGDQYQVFYLSLVLFLSGLIIIRGIGYGIKSH